MFESDEEDNGNDDDDDEVVEEWWGEGGGRAAAGGALTHSLPPQHQCKLQVQQSAAMRASQNAKKCIGMRVNVQQTATKWVGVHVNVGGNTEVQSSTHDTWVHTSLPEWHHVTRCL